MKKIYFIVALICSINYVKAQDGLELLFQWSDESISDDNWVGCKYNEVWGIAQNAVSERLPLQPLGLQSGDPWLSIAILLLLDLCQ